MHEEDDGAGDAGKGEQAEAHQHVADLADDVERQDAFDVVLGERTGHADHHRQSRQGEDERPEIVHAGQHMEPNQDVHPDLGQEASEHGGDRRGRCRVAVGKPREQREDGGLGAEDDEEPQADAPSQRIVELGDALGEQGQIDRAGRGVDDGEADEEEG